jgi:hypothetical protein
VARRRHVDNAGARLAAEVNDYGSANNFLGSRLERKIANNTYIVSTGDDNISGRLHNTNIITWYTTGDIQLNAGHYETVTTKARLNAFLEGTPWSIAAKRGEWFVHHSRSGEKTPFVNGMFLDAPGDAYARRERERAGNPARPSSRGGPPGKRPPSRHAHTVPIKGYSVRRHSRRRPLEYARNPDRNIHDYAMMVTDGARGQYAPADFTTNWQASIFGVPKNVLEDVMSGPDNEYYWDSWASILDNAYVQRDIETHRWNIHQSGDIWLVRQDAPDWVWEQLTDY